MPAVSKTASGAQDVRKAIAPTKQGAQEGTVARRPTFGAAQESLAKAFLMRASQGAAEAKGSTPAPLAGRTLQVKEWHYNTSVHTSGFIVDRCTVVYTHVSPATFTAIADEFANAQTGDFVDVYVTIDGIETEVFQGVVKEWRWEEGPDGVQ